LPIDPGHRAVNFDGGHERAALDVGNHRRQHATDDEDTGQEKNVPA
jgi:hypothetical protein